MFLEVQLIISHHWFRLWLATKQVKSMTWSNDDTVHWHCVASLGHNEFTHCGLIMHICGSKLRYRDGLSPVQCQTITWTNADLLSINCLRTNLSELSTKIDKYYLKKKNTFENACKMSAICSSYNVLKWMTGQWCKSHKVNHLHWKHVYHIKWTLVNRKMNRCLYMCKTSFSKGPGEKGYCFCLRSNHRTWNSKDLVDHDQKLIIVGESHIESICQVCSQSGKWFMQKCKEN